MKIKKFIIPAVACVAALASCNKGTPFTDVEEAKKLFYNAIVNTVSNLDNVSLKLQASGIKGKIAYDLPGNNESESITAKLSNLAGTLEVKAANLQKMAVDEKGAVTDPIVATAKISDVAFKGDFTIPGGIIPSGENDASASKTYSFDESIDGIKAYFNYANSKYAVYGDLSDKKIVSTLKSIEEKIKSDLPKGIQEIIDAYAPIIYATLGDNNTNKVTYPFDSDTTKDIVDVLGSVPAGIKGAAEKIGTEAWKTEAYNQIETYFTWCTTEGNLDSFSAVKYGENNFTVTASIGASKINTLAQVEVLEKGTIKASVSANEKGLSKVSLELNDISTKDGSAATQGASIKEFYGKLSLELDHITADSVLNDLKVTTDGKINWYDISKLIGK